MALVNGAWSCSKFGKGSQISTQSSRSISGWNNSNWDGWSLNDDSTPVNIRAIQGHCSRPFASREFFKNMIEVPHGWTTVIYHSSSPQYLDKFLLTGLIAGAMGRKEGRQACYVSAAHPRKSLQHLITKVGHHGSFLVKAQVMDL